MAVSAYEVISTQTLGSAAASVTFSSIPQTYTDLVLVSQIQNTGSLQRIDLRFNSDSSSNYSVTRIYGSGSTASSDRFTSASGIDIAYVATSGYCIVNNSIMNYSNTTTFKSIVGRWSSEGNSGYTAALVGLWRNTAAITSMVLTPLGVNFATGSTFTLYGVKAA